MDIVLIRTDSDKLWPRPEYFSAHPGMTEEATSWLVEQGIKALGIDANGFDLPFMEMVRAYLTTGNSQVLWPAHMYGRTHEYIHMERLANLRHLPRSHGFQVACFPVAIRDAGAAWVRAVAIV
jgi:kynurenine formamidase